MIECSFLNRCVASFDEAGRSFASLTAEMTPGQASWRPSPDRWSVLECLEHLNVTERLYVPRMAQAIRRGRERQILGRAPFDRRSLLGRLILGALAPEAGRRVKAPSIFRPKREASLDLARVGNDFSAGMDRLRELAKEADGLDLARLRLASPIAPFPRLTLAEAFEIHALHIPRHLAQAGAVARAPGFPAQGS